MFYYFYFHAHPPSLQKFWWPALKWAVDMRRYRRGGGAIWRPVNLLDVNVPLFQHGGVRPRPRPAYRLISRDVLASKKTTKKAESTQVIGTTTNATPRPSTVPGVASGSSARQSWLSPTTLAKLHDRRLELFTATDIKEMEMVSVMLRTFEDERVRSPDP